MQPLRQLLKKLIRTGAGRTRFAMAIIGLSVAMLLILAAVQVQVNYNDLLYSKHNRDSIANFLVINKVLTDKNLGATALTDADISDIRHQPFTDAVGLLSPGRFKASIQSNSSRFPFYTDIAFESVPDAFIDITPKDWKWEEGQSLIPIIVPSMFLDFYNFQFSFSQNLPQLTQEVVKMIVFKVNVYGPEGVSSFNGRVVGFSDRISSLLVPHPFMNWANSRFATTAEAKPSRVIIRTKDPGNPALVEYLKEKGLNTDADKTRFSRYRQVVDLVVNISWGTGAVMLLFAMLIFTLFIQLTVASCKEEIRLLMILGASPKQLQVFLFRQFFPSSLLIVSVSLVLIAIFQYLAQETLRHQNIYIHPFLAWQTLSAALFMLVMIAIVNKASIRKYIRITQ